MPYYYGYGFDWTYLVLVLPCMILAMWASANVNSTFKKYSSQHSYRNLTGAEAAQRVLRHNGVTGVRIERVSGNLTDHYDPRTNVIRLSDSVYSSTSTAAIGVAAHEAGHAVQYAQNYAPIKVRAAIIPVCNFGSMLAMPLFLFGLILVLEPLMWFGIIAYSLTALFQLITLPVEFNASRRAMTILSDSGRFTDDQLRASRRVLSAAALTYVAALASALLSLLRLVLIANRNSRD